MSRLNVSRNGSCARRAGLLMCSLLLAGPWALPLNAQGVWRLVRPTPARGWVGFSVEQLATGSTSVVWVTDVHEGSPADRAGLRVGDRLVAVGEAAATGSTLARLQASLRAGQRLHLTVVRDGGTREVEVEAAPRPAPEELVLLSASTRGELEAAFRVFLDRLDTLIAQPGAEFGYAVRGVPGSATVFGTFSDSTKASGSVTIRSTTTRWSSRGESETPIGGSFDLRIEASPGIIALRPWVDMASPDTSTPFAIATEERTVVVRAREHREVLERTLSERRRTASATTAPGAEVRAGARIVAAASERDVRRPLAPYIIGQDRVAGAQLTPVGSELGAYFGVRDGLLVLQVMAGTPAAQAGVRPGDVIVGLGDEPVLTIEELRRRVDAAVASRRDEDRAIDVIRRGRHLHLLLAREP